MIKKFSKKIFAFTLSLLMILSGAIGFYTKNVQASPLSTMMSTHVPNSDWYMNEPTVGYGSTGTFVIQLQASLNEISWRLGIPKYNPGEVDGIFGSKTLAAVKAFQSDYNLSVDGIVGVMTWSTINEVLYYAKQGKRI